MQMATFDCHLGVNTLRHGDVVCECEVFMMVLMPSATMLVELLHACLQHASAIDPHLAPCRLTWWHVLLALFVGEFSLGCTW